jgi:hypothetical protein
VKMAAVTSASCWLMTSTDGIYVFQLPNFN